MRAGDDPAAAKNPAGGQSRGGSMAPDHLAFLDELNLLLGSASLSQGVGIALVALECVSRIDGMLGYRAGDDLCGQVAVLLGRALRQEDSVHRVGRNELACLLHALPSEGHAVLAAHKILRALDHRLEVAGTLIHAIPFVGVTMAEPGACDADTLLRRANVAMHEAKRMTDRYAVYRPELDEPRRLQLSFQTALLAAIAENTLDVNFQPKLDLRSSTIVGVETLVRWNPPATGPVSPSQFIPVAEASGFISDLTLRVLNAALCHYEAMSAVFPQLHLAVNLSPKDLQERQLAEVVRQALGAWCVPPDRLVLELTETAVMEDDAVYGASLDRLKETGIRLSIDDFGTGYSSMSRLRTLPVDELKIDMSFVQNILTSPADDRIVRSMITLAHDLGIPVVAEGVEDEPTLERLRALGCDLVQGYHVSKPLGPRETLSFLKERG